MEISVISFNIRFQDDGDGHSIAERSPRLHQITERCDADIIGFQEFTPPWEKHIEKNYSDKYDMFLKYRNETVDIEASPILWKKDKFDCIKTGYFWLSDTPETESCGYNETFYRMCVYVILKEKQSGTCFTVMNTHFGFSDTCHMGSAKLIHRYSQKISDYPTFVVGDFNMTPGSKGYNTMIENFIDANSSPLNKRISTYHGYNPEKDYNLHIDYCFINDKIAPVSYEILTDCFNGKFPSDHFGLYIHLSI